MQTKKSEYTPEEFESKVNKGMVFGKNGDWCSINKAINEEKELHTHLENGEVFHNGEWIHIIEVLAYENTDIQSEPVFLKQNKGHNQKKIKSFKNRKDKSSPAKNKRKRDFESQKKEKKANKGKRENGKKTGSDNFHKVKKDSLSVKEDKRLLKDVNIQVDKPKKSEFEEAVFKPEVKLSDPKNTVSKAKIIDPGIKKKAEIEIIKLKSEPKTIGNENEIPDLIDVRTNKIDFAQTQIIEKTRPKSQKAINIISKPGLVSSEKTIIKKLSKENSTFDENITQIIPLSIHIFKGKQIKAKRKRINSQIEKNKSVPDESLDDWAKIRSNFIKNTMFLLVSAILVFICFYLLYYFVIL